MIAGSDLGSLLSRVARRLDTRHRKLRAFAASRVRSCSAPYSIKSYDDGLAAIVDAGFRVPHFASTDPVGDVPDVYFRHDIDLSDCPARLPALIEAELRRGVRAGVFFQANERAPYKLRACRELAQELSSMGIEIGLHTICYTSASPWKGLNEEIASFRDALGMHPKSINAHGLGPYRLAERIAFYRDFTEEKMKEMGFSYSDLSESLRRYDYCVEDCHISPGFSSGAQGDPFALLPIEARYIKDDLHNLPMIPRLRYLVLTHPGYWR
jgi:hypothetical protein